MDSYKVTVTEQDIELVRQKYALPGDAGQRLAPLNSPNIEALPKPATQIPVDLEALARGYAGQSDAMAQAQGLAAGPGLFIFVSLTMPRATLQGLVDQAARAKATIVIRGFAKGSLRDTVTQVQDLIGKQQVAIQIDPLAFDRFAISKVPSFVLVRDGTRSERADATLADRTSFAERVSSAYDKGESISIDIAQDPHNLEMFLRYAQTYGGNSAAAHALMSAELARQSLRPNRVISDGSSLPTSFGDVRDLHQEQLNDVAITPDIKATHQAQVSKASRFGSNPSRPLEQKTEPPSPVREEVQQRAIQIHGEAAAKREEFDGKAEIIKTDDGTLASRKSLMWQSARQVYKDGEATVGNAKDAVQDLIKSKK